MMKPSEQTTQQIERFLKKIAQKFPANDEASMVTDIHVRPSSTACYISTTSTDSRDSTTRRILRKL